MSRTENHNSASRQKKEDSFASASLVKWASLILMLISSLISIVWFAASIKTDVSSLRDEISSVRREGSLINERYKKEIENLEKKNIKHDSDLNDFGRKLDVIEAVLIRVEVILNRREDKTNK
jgi:hypothetical protein